MDYLYPLNAIHCDGRVELLYTVEEVHNFIKRVKHFREHHVEYYYVRGYWDKTPQFNEWVVRDDRGRVVKYNDFVTSSEYLNYYAKRHAKIRQSMEKGLPIPYTGCSKAGWKMNHTAKKNSGSGHRNRNRAFCQEVENEYGVKNTLGKPIPYEGW